MKIKLSSTTLLVIALAALSSWYFIYEKQIKLSKQTESENQKRLLGWSSAEVQELEVARTQGDSFKLKKSGDEWLITAPVTDSADKAVINSLLSALTNAEIERTVEESPQSLEPFGLAKPEVIIKAVKDANNSKEIRLGEQTQVGQGIYVQTSEGPKVLRLNRSLKTNFEKSTFDVRNKKLVTIPANEIKEVELSNLSGTFIVAKNNNEKWILARESYPADTSKWGKMLETISGLRATAVTAETGELQNYGLAKPQIRIGLTATKSETLRENILISQHADKIFAKRDEKPFIYEIDKAIFAELNRSAADFRDLHLVSFNRDAIDRIRIQRGGSQAELKKEGAQWVLSDLKPEEKTDSEKIEKLLATLEDMKATSVQKTEAITQPSFVIELFQKKDAAEILVGKIEFSKASSTEMRGKSTYLPQGWKIPSSEFQNIDLGRDSFLQAPNTKPAENKES